LNGIELRERIHARKRSREPSIALVGAGKLAVFLAISLRSAGFEITEIIGRDSPPSLRKARLLAKKVGARAATVRSAALDASLIWFCVPDSEISPACQDVANRLAIRAGRQLRFAFHSSGALLSRELQPLRRLGVAAASVHPFMTFIAGTRPSLRDVPFALEGERAATQMARQIVRALGGDAFSLAPTRKPAYHAWATMSSPLLLALLVTLEEAAIVAGVKRDDARRKSLPIMRQTLANYERLGPARSFSGPFVRGDAKTVATHLAALKGSPDVRDVYRALAKAAIKKLPTKNHAALKKILD
jgi:predicted short-subunit dehydrogenase-like oxidoreductase (DUF2520 family)